MRIGIDVGPLTAHRTGVGNYCYQLLSHMADRPGDDELLGLSASARPIDLDGLEGRIRHRHLRVPARVMYRVWQTLGAPRVDKLLGGLDVYHATNFFLPPAASAKRVLTIYDLAFLTMPHLCSPKVVGPFGKSIVRSVHEADAIIAVSEATRRDIIDTFKIDEARVRVVHGAANPALKPVDPETAREHLARLYGLRTPFLLFVSTLEPRKNVPGLLRAFAELVNTIPHRLVLAGEPGWNSRVIDDTIAEFGLADRVLRAGFVSDDQLTLFYSAADCFVFPTYCEGFGLPLVEAMTCGCPVVSSRVSSVPEVTGQAALLCDPDDAEGLADAILRVLDDRALREHLVRKGHEQAKKFSWQASAEATLDLYREVAL